MMYCFSTGLHTKVAKTPPFLLVLTAGDNSPLGDLTILFSNQLHETMPSYAELVFYMFSMSSAVDCTGRKLIAPDY